MSSFGIGGHAHIDAAVFSVLLTLFIYGVKWLFGFKFPAFIFVLPTFVAIFLGFYTILYVAFLIAWTRK
ncbi:MAG: hypothetical protein HYU64_15360 [Armatimonadetes bacterium]|nr:hypothetical protein [Armatimonadota bacterium]